MTEDSETSFFDDEKSAPLTLTLGQLLTGIERGRVFFDKMIAHVEESNSEDLNNRLALAVAAPLDVLNESLVAMLSSVDEELRPERAVELDPETAWMWRTLQNAVDGHPNGPTDEEETRAETSADEQTDAIDG